MDIVDPACAVLSNFEVLQLVTESFEQVYVVAICLLVTPFANMTCSSFAAKGWGCQGRCRTLG
eukprot:m.121359 g.121359  ORF g.121359 m.121359 type:complete len:63 (+) comp13381_c0_seq2:4043-4231(+)